MKIILRNSPDWVTRTVTIHKILIRRDCLLEFDSAIEAAEGRGKYGEVRSFALNDLWANWRSYTLNYFQVKRRSQ